MDNAMLKAVGITKKYNRHIILSGVDLSVEKGEGIALVGENGCGKSTLIRILSGLTKPTSGKVYGYSKLRMGFIPDRYEKISLTIRNFMRHMLALEGAERSVLERYYKDFNLESMLDIPMKYLSKGTLQKVAVIQALLCDRDVLFMDEPLSGQDTYSKAGFAAELRKKKDNGMAVIMACHEPYLIEELADRIIQIKNGALYDGAGYIFSKSRSACHFLIDYGGDFDLTKLIENEAIIRSITVSKLGPMYMLKADRIYAQGIFQILLSKNVHIVKYEESEEQC